MEKIEHNCDTIYEEVKRKGYERKKIKGSAKRKNDKEILIKKKKRNVK